MRPVTGSRPPSENLGVGVDDREDSTLAATATATAIAIAAHAGARVFRAHQVRRIRSVLDMVASIAGTRPPSRCIRALSPDTHRTARLAARTAQDARPNRRTRGAEPANTRVRR